MTVRHSSARLRPMFLHLVLASFLSLGLVACGGGDDKPAAQANAGAGNGTGGGGGKGGGRPGGGPPQAPVPVAIDSVTRGTISSYYTATATLDPDKQAEILARVAGVVTSVTAEEGDRVTKGSTLLKIQDEEYRLRLLQAQAEEAKQKTKFDRLDRMFKENLISADEFETTTNDYKAAEAAAALAQLQLSYTHVEAPFTGRVTRRHVDPGQTVSNGTALYSLVDMSTLLARVHVPAREFREIQLDQTVLLKVDSNAESLRGTIQLVSPIIDPTTGTIKVTVEVKEYPSTIRPGDFAEVSIVTDRHDGSLLVPRIAVVSDKGERVLYVVAADSTAERRVVEVGFEDTDHAEILSGVVEGEPVVIQGQRSLRHGAPLKIMDPMKFEDDTPVGVGS